MIPDTSITNKAKPNKIDWILLLKISPALIWAVALVMFLLFIVIPTVFGMHDAHVFSLPSNLQWLLMALAELGVAKIAFNYNLLGSVIMSSGVINIAAWF